MKRAQSQRILSGFLAVATAVSMIATPRAAAAGADGLPDMGPADVATEKVYYTDGSGRTVEFHRSVRDPNIRPDQQLKLTSDSDYLRRSFQRSLDYAYDELVVGPRQFPLNSTGDDNRVQNHYQGIGNYTSTAVPSIWGTYHGFPGGSYRECFCDRDVSHTAEAGSLLALNEENYGMLSRFAEESVNLWWRGTTHEGWDLKGPAQMWFPLWSQDYYGDAYFMDASFRELPAPFEVLDKVWMQYRWTGDERWINDAMLNYGYHIHSYENGLMEHYDYDGDGLVDNVFSYDWAPTLYEYEDASEMQRQHVAFSGIDQPSGDSAYPLKTTVTLKPDFFSDHEFYQLPIDMKLIGSKNGESSVQGEAQFILRVNGKEPADLSTPAVMRNYDRVNSRKSDIKAVEIPLNLPAGYEFEVYEGDTKLTRDTDYTVDATNPVRPVITIKADYLYQNFGEKKINLGIVTRFYQSSDSEHKQDVARGTTELCLNTGNTIPEKDAMNIAGITKTVGGVDTVLSELETDEDTGVIYLDYAAADKDQTSYTFTLLHRDPITPRMTQGSNPAKLKEYFKVTSDLVRVLVAGDTIGCQYQALRGMANMIQARIDRDGEQTFQPYHYEKDSKEKIPDGNPIRLDSALVQYYNDRADAVQQSVKDNWTDPTWGYARAINRLGEKDGGWGHENSFFMPMKELLEAGEPTQKYLNFIQMNALMDEQLNEEALTYMPETFYMHGQNTSGWQWSKVSMNRLDPEQRTESEIMSTYPEIALINIYNTVNLLMGVEPAAAKREISTLPRLTDEVGWVQVENIPLTQSGRDALSWNGRDSDNNPRADAYSKPKIGTLYTVRHDGTALTTLTNQGLGGNPASGDNIVWNAQFYGDFDTLYVTRNGESVPVTGGAIHKLTYPPFTTYTSVTVAPGETVSVSTLADPTLPPPNTTGTLSLSDQNWLFASYPNSGGRANPPKKNATYTGAALYRYDFQESWPKGVGTRPNTTIRYLIPAEATGFTTEVALTDFKRQTNPADTKAEVTFQVYVDNVLRETRIANRENLEPQQISLAFDFPKDGRMHTLDLVTTAAQNSGEGEGAAWIMPQLAVEDLAQLPDELPENNLFLSDLTPEHTNGRVALNASMESGKPITMGNRTFQKGIGTTGETEAAFGLGGVYQSLDLVLGYQDGRSGKTRFQVYLDDSQVPAFDQILEGSGSVNTPSPCTVSLITDTETGKCADTVRLVTKRVEGVNQDAANWGECLLTLKAGTDLTDPAIIAKRILTAPDATLGQSTYRFPEIPVSNPEGYEISILSSSNTAVLDTNGIITPDAAEHAVDVVFRIAELGGDKRTGTTKSFSVYIPAIDKVSLARLKFTGSDEGNGRPVVNQDSDGKKIKLDGVEYDTGLGLRAAGKCEAVFDLADGAYKRFTAKVGYAQNSGYNNNDFFRIIIEGVDAKGGRTELYGSPVILKGPYESNAHKDCPNCAPVLKQYGYTTSDLVDIDIPDGFVKLAIRAERIGDSFWGYAAVCNPYFYLNSPYDGKTVESIDSSAVQTVAGAAPKLPQSVRVKYEGMEQKRTLRVTWDPIDPDLYAQGKEDTSFTVEGSAAGVDTPRALCTVEVKGKIVVSAKDVKASTTIGVPPQLPTQVEVTYNDNAVGKADVEWDTEGQTWNKAGSVTIEGLVVGTQVKVRCVVTVTDPRQVPLVSLTPESATAPNGLEFDKTFTLGGTQSYEHSIFAHANSELVYDLGGKYTRFTTALGSKQAGENPNIIFRAYGIDANAAETLLYDTDLVTKVVDPSAPPRTADRSGYYYVGGSTIYSVDVDVTGYQKLKLVADNVGTPNTDHATYGTPILYTTLSPMGQDLRVVTVTAGEGGAVWPNGRVAVSSGEDLILTVKPNPANPAVPAVKQMALDLLLVNGTTAAPTDNGDGTYTLTLSNVTENKTVSATFREKSDAPALGTLAPGLTAGDGKVTLAAMSGAEGERFYYKTTPSTDLANRPAYGDRVDDRWTLLAGSTDISGANGTAIFVQVIKANDAGITAWGEASATPQEVVPEVYTLTVVNGTGGGTYAAGESVTATAEIPPNQFFQSWTAVGMDLTETQAAANPLTFSMPAKSVTLTAHFEAMPTLGALEPVLTPGDGKITLGAMTGAEGERFLYQTSAESNASNQPDYGETDLTGWTAFDTDTELEGENGTPIFVQTVKVTDVGIVAWGEASATPTEPRPDTYLVTVIGGKLEDGSTSAYFVAGGEVTVTANPAPQGQQFKSWTTDGVALEDDTAETVTFLMPESAVALTANFGELPSVSLDRNSVILYLGSTPTARLTAIVRPQDAVVESLTWSSDAENVVTVENGLLTAIGPGGAVVTVTAVTADGTFTDRCVVTVTDYVAPPTSGGSSGSTTKTEKNPDGSITTTVTDKKTGTITATTKWSDGTVERIVTEKNGTVTKTVTTPAGKCTETVIDLSGKLVETVTEPDGKQVKTVIEKNGDRTITVTDKDGAPLAKVELPARVPAPEKAFTDLGDYRWAKDAVDFTVGMGLLSGTGKESFSAGLDMSRGMLVTSLHRLSGKVAGDGTAFEDVESGVWYADAVAWAAGTGIVEGKDGRFSPNDSVTREQLAAMLYRYAALLGRGAEHDSTSLDSFSDANAVSTWAKEAMAWAVESGVLTGKSGGVLDASGTATRAEAAVMLQRFISYLAKA